MLLHIKVKLKYRALSFYIAIKVSCQIAKINKLWAGEHENDEFYLRLTSLKHIKFISAPNNTYVTK